MNITEIKMKSIFVCILPFMLLSCSEIQVRRPINNSKSVSFEESIRLNKALIRTESYKIQRFIDLDSVNTYDTTKNGVNYFFNKKEEEGRIAKYQDLATIKYELKTLRGRTILRDSMVYKVGKQDILKGIDEIVSILKENETITAIIPSYMAYGYYSNKEQGIEINQTLIGKITLINIEKQ